MKRTRKPHIFPTGWSKWNGNCYILVGGEDSSARQNFDYAASQCRSMDSRAHLASIHSVQGSYSIEKYFGLTLEF